MSVANSSNDSQPSREEIYQAFLRSLRRRRGFGIVFMQCPPAEAKRIIGRVHQDLPQKQIATLTLTEPIDNLYDRVKYILDRDHLSILFIQGLEKSLEPYIKPGYGGDGDYYNLDTVPTILSHLNQRRELFRDNFPTLCFVFVLPAFAIKYFIRRAPDFFDWSAGVFEFSVDKVDVTATIAMSVDKGEHQIDVTNYVQIGDTVYTDRELSDLRRSQGEQLVESKQFDEALIYYEEALQLYRKLGDQAEIASTLTTIGNVFQGLEHYDQALSSYQEAVAISEQINNQVSQASALGGLGETYLSLGDYQQAIDYLQPALTIQQQIDDAKGEAFLLANLGNSYQSLGQYTRGIEYFQRALRIQRDICDRKGEAASLTSLGNAYRALAQYQRAIEYFQQALPIQDQVGDLNGKVDSLSSLGRVFYSLKQYEQSIAAYDTAIKISQELEIDKTAFFSQLLFNRGNALKSIGRLEESIKSYDQAIEIEPSSDEARSERQNALAQLGRLTKPWSIPNIAESLLGIVSGKGWDRLTQSLTKIDVEKAIQAGAEAVDEWEKQLDSQQRLFFNAPPDGWNGVKKFWRDYFTKSAVLAEFQKPLINQGKPDREILITVFQQQAEANNIKLNQDSLKPWVETFVNAYFQQTATYLKYQVAKQDYCQQLANWFDDVKFAGIAVPGQEVEKSEKLAQIFVMPDVVEEVLTPRDLELERLVRESGEKSEKALLEKTTGRKFLAEQLLSQSQSRRVVILGAPGSGKTTLISYFAVMLAQSNPKVLGLDANTDWLPILIRMRDLARHPDQSLIDYARGFAEKRIAVNTLPVGFFEHWLSDGRALILLDGLDEVAEDAKRYDVVSRINNFLGQFDRNRAIITSRPAGYRRDFFRTEDFPHYQIQPFDDQKISAFIDNWYNSRFQDQSEAQRRKQSLRKVLEDNDRINLLAQNPLLLTIIALIHRYQAALPKERYKLYDKAVETLLTSWDANKELSSDKWLTYLGLDDLRRLMEWLAYWIHTQGNVEDNDSGTLIDRDELIDQLSQQIKTLKHVQLYQAKEEAKRFVELIRERTGLLNEQGQDCYGFVHKTFQEYLCAQEINYQADNEGDFEIVLNHIGEHLHDSHWREVLLLLIAQQKPKKAAKAIKAVLTNNSNYEQWLHRDLLFAGKCLAEDPKNLRGTDSGLVQQILERLVELEVSSEERVGERVYEQVFQVIGNLYETDFEAQVLELLKERSHLIDQERLLNYRAELGEKDEVITILLARLQDENSDVCSKAANALVRLGNSSETVLSTLLARLQDKNSDVHRWAAYALGRLGKSSETVLSTLLARLQDKNSDVRGGAADALGRLGNSSETVVNPLIALLQDDDYSVRQRAALALGNSGNSSETVVNPLIALLQDDDSDVRVAAAYALGKLGNSSESVVSALIALLQDDDSDVRREAADALGQLKNSSETVVSALIALLQDDDCVVRGEAADALGNLGNSSESVVSALIALLQDNDCVVRGEAADALGNLGNSSESIVSALIALLQDNDCVVRGEAADALGNLGNSSETVVSTLLALLQDDDLVVRGRAAEALGNLGNSSETVVSTLLALLQDHDSEVRGRAAEALGKLGKTSNHVLPSVIKWIEQHQDCDYVGSGIDVLWDLVVGRE
ncbi:MULTISPECIES: HEAT repeat domain-containing protein [unclassified Moorena]|uniref:HEAT repeat domain-containing protein n=1 Tax=unclassified Moorena TaxID=2683338 RepID=UPI0014004E23|nr:MULTISPECIES: HEAT repeat domain-containing protein [unclassified Moorena]NEO11737.1 tetratricopeptide repeat protein [Moorena sp. SIO3E8]NEP98248.1 tetratricopeptide repeat protein [Moorena sp. SIO3F7]